MKFPTPPLRVALIGCGLISEAHVRGHRAHSDRARITVCCDIDAEKAGACAASVGDGARAVTDVAEVVADPDIDAVEVCTPHHLHADAVVAAARAGKHVLCQKPLARTLEECDRMIAAARDAGVVLFYGESNRTMRPAVEAKRAVDAGRIGTLTGIQATYAHWQGGAYLGTAWRYDPKVTGGGQLLDGGIHYIDLMLHVGGPIESVTCFTTRFRPELGGEDTAVLNARFVGGPLGTLYSSQAAGIWYPGASFIAFGTDGVLSIGGPHGALALHRPDVPNRCETLLEHGGDGFTVMIGRFLDAVLDGARNPAPGEIGRDALRVVLAAYEAAETGREVRV